MAAAGSSLAAASSGPTVPDVVLQCQLAASWVGAQSVQAGSAGSVWVAGAAVAAATVTCPQPAEFLATAEAPDLAQLGADAVGVLELRLLVGVPAGMT